jgi:hypothetical protein
MIFMNPFGTMQSETPVTRAKHVLSDAEGTQSMS